MCVKRELGAHKEEEKNFIFNFPQLQILHPRSPCFYWNRDQKTASVYDALKHAGQLECGIVNLYIWLCLTKTELIFFPVFLQGIWCVLRRLAIVTLREIMFIILIWRIKAKGTVCVKGEMEDFCAQREGIILHCPNDRLNKPMGAETTLHSINCAFVVSELLMMYKGSSAAPAWTTRALCSQLFSGKRGSFYTWRHISCL